MQRAGLVLIAWAVMLGLSPAVWAQTNGANARFTMAELFHAKGFVCPETAERVPLDNKKMLANFTLFSDGVQDARVADDGAFTFKMTAPKATLYWGDKDDNQPLDRRIYLPNGYIIVRVTAQQSSQVTSTWTMAFWTDGKRQAPQAGSSNVKLCGTNSTSRNFKVVRQVGRGVSAEPSDVRTAHPEGSPYQSEDKIAPSSGPNPGILLFLRDVKDAGTRPDGLEFIIEGEKGNEIRLTGLEVLVPLYKGCFRKEFVLPEGTIWRAAATVGQQTVLYVNGQLVPDISPIRARPVATGREGNYRTRAIDLKPWLKAGTNCVALEAGFPQEPPYVYFQSRIIMADGSSVPVAGDETWKWSPTPAANWPQPGFDDRAWALVASASTKASNDVPLAKAVPDLGFRWKSGSERPADDGLMILENPYERSLFYTDRQPVHVNMRVPAGLADRQPAVAWKLENYDGENDRFCELGKAGSGAQSQFERAGDSLVYKLDLGLLKRGVYTLQTCLNSSQGTIAERIPEPFIVVGRIPMKTTPGDAYEDGMELVEETTIDFTNPADPHPWLEADGLNLSRGQVGLNQLKTAQKQNITEPIIIEKNGLKYRETRPNSGAQFSYKIDFKHPGDFYLMVMEYPDDKERWMGADCSSQWRGLTAYSKIGPSVFTGWKFPVTGAMEELKWIYRPDPGPHTVRVINLQKDNAAAAARMRVYHIKGGLPELGGRINGERRLGLLTENASLVNSFGQTFSITRTDAAAQIATTEDLVKYYDTVVRGGKDVQPVARACQGLFLFLDASEAYAQYLRWAGQNLHVMGSYQYKDSHVLRPLDDPASSRVNLDLQDVAVRVFRENGISVIGSVEFMTLNALSQQAPAASRGNGEVRAGADTFFIVDRDGKQCSEWNFLHPQVEKAMLDIAGALAGQWKDQTNVIGQNWTAYLGKRYFLPVYSGCAVDPREPSDPMDAGYDDATIKRFEADTGIETPGDARDPKRFEKRYAFLTGPDMKEKWIKWRCEKVRDLFVKIRDRVQEQRRGLRCFASLYFDVAQAYEWTQSGLPLREFLRLRGWDIDLLKKEKDVWVTHWMHSTARYFPANHYRGFPAAIHAAGWRMSADPEFYDLFARDSNRCQMNMHHWCEIEKVAFTMPWRADWTYPAQSTLQAQASGANASEVFTQGLIGGDPELVMFGFSHVSLMGGHEQPMREFARVLRALPGDRFQPVRNTGLTSNLAIRDLTKDGKYFFYVANPGYWPISGQIVLANCKAVRDLVKGQAVGVQPRGQDAVLKVALKPYGVAAYQADGTAAKVIAWENDPVPDRELRHIKDLMEQGRAALEEPAPSRLLPAQDQALVRQTIAETTACLQSNQYAQAWARLMNWKYWSFLRDDLARVDDFDPWLLVGPMASEADQNGVVKYPAWPQDQEGWQAVQRDGTALALTVYLAKNHGDTLQPRYAAVEIQSSKAQTVHLELGKFEHGKVWVNGARCSGDAIELGDKSGRYGVEARLWKGWNRIVCLVHDQTVLKDPAFLTVIGPAAASEKFDYRLPQMDLGGPKPVYRVNCGANVPWAHWGGNVWLADHDYSDWATDRIGFGHIGGKVARRKGQNVKNTELVPLFQWEFWGMDGYRFHVPNGKYTVRLYFAEMYMAGKGRRLFDVVVQDKQRIDSLDIFAEAGLDAALIKTFENVEVADGVLKIDFKGVSAPTAQEINAIEVIRQDG